MKNLFETVIRRLPNLISVASLCALAGCSSYLRAPFCVNPLSSFPDDFQGIYDVTIPTQSAEWGSNMLLKSTQIEVRGDRILATNNFPGFNFNARICTVNGRYFGEQQNSDGTYSVSEYTRFSDGMIISGLNLDLERIRKAKFGLQYLPKDIHFLDDTDSKTFSFGTNPSIFILDNRKMTSELVLSFSTPVSYQLVLRKHAKPTPLIRVKHTIRLQTTRL